MNTHSPQCLRQNDRIPLSPLTSPLVSPMGFFPISNSQSADFLSTNQCIYCKRVYHTDIIGFNDVLRLQDFDLKTFRTTVINDGKVFKYILCYYDVYLHLVLVWVPTTYGPNAAKSLQTTTAASSFLKTIAVVAVTGDRLGMVTLLVM